MTLSREDLECAFRSHGPVIRRLLKRRFHPSLDDSDIDDVLSAALLRVWERRSRYAGGGSLFSLIYLVAKRIAIDAVTRRPPTQPLADDHAGTDRTEGTDNRVSLERLRRAYEELSELDQRIIDVSTKYRADVNWAADLSNEVGLSPGNLRVRRTRALKKLRQSMGSDGPMIDAATTRGTPP